MQILFILLLYIFAALPHQVQPDNLIKIKRISNRVATFDYLDVNVTAVKSKSGILVIDTHRSPATMRKILDLIEKEFGRNDFIFVINTHGDYDHSSGNQVFPHAIIIGHENCPEHMHLFPANTSKAKSFFKQEIADMKETLIKRTDKDLPDPDMLRERIDVYSQMLLSIENEYRVTPPVRTFKDSLTLGLGDLTVKMFYPGKAHTDNDILIYIPEEKLVFTGDLFTSKYSFGFAVSKMEDNQLVIPAMNLILQNKSGVEWVIPGHGDYFSGNDFSDLRDLLIKKSLK